LGKLLIVSWCVHPWPTGSSVIVNNIASQFTKEELVLYGEKYPNEDDRPWDSNYPRIIYGEPRLTVNDTGYRYLKWLSVGKLVKQLEQIVEEEGVSKLLCIYPSDFYMYIAYRVSRTKSIPMYSWFHNTYLDNVQGAFKLLAKLLQPVFFRHSKINFVMSDGMRDYYQKVYPGVEFKTLVHGFKLPNNTGVSRISHADKKRKFLFAGNLNESCRDATIRLIKTIIANPDYVVHAFTSSSVAYFSSFGIEGDNFVVRGFVPLEHLYDLQREYDVMLLPHGFDGGRTQVEYDTIFPTRTIPMLVSGRPILAHSPKGTFLTKFLEAHECAVIVTEKSAEKILEAVKQLLTEGKYIKRLVEKAWKAADGFRIENTVQELKELTAK